MAVVIFSGMAMFHVSSNLGFHCEMLFAQNFDTIKGYYNKQHWTIINNMKKKSLVFVS